MTPFTPLPKAIATVCLSGALPEKLQAAAAVGFDGVEIFENDLLTFEGAPADVKNICDGLGLAIPLYQPLRDFEGMPEPQRTRNLDRAERKFDVMQALGTDLVLVCSNMQSAALDDPARLAEDLAAIAERAARRGLRVGYEALAFGRHVTLWRQAWDLVRQVDHPALGLIVDSFHTLALDDDPSGLAEVPGEKIFFVQLADAPRLNMDVLTWGRHFRNFPGQGDLDVTGFVRAVLASGYRGPLSLEVFNDDFRAAPARMTARDGLRSLIHVEAMARGGAGLPPTPALDGVEFLEFAVDEPTGEALAGFVRALGFRHAGRHRSKDVDLYRQGRTNLVLNREQDSAAAEHFQLHGPSVCAMGLRVDDADLAVSRAKALLYPDWIERVGAGERRIPAVRAPDGTLVYLVQTDPSGRSIWEDDFDLRESGPGRDGVGLDDVDHVAYALPFGRMDTYVLFWRALFGLEPAQQWVSPDPYGLIRSKALISPERSLRLSLNVSEGRETALGRSLAAYSGAGVHHVAFATEDMVRTVEALRRLDAPLLPVPANYYDDTDARLSLDDALLADLQRLGLLYDRDEGGEFLHAYTEAFEGRFFFEAVQRRGYQGFGSYLDFGVVNTAVSMANEAKRRKAAGGSGLQGRSAVDMESRRSS